MLLPQIDCALECFFDGTLGCAFDCAFAEVQAVTVIYYIYIICHVWFSVGKKVLQSLLWCCVFAPCMLLSASACVLAVWDPHV